MSLFKNAMRFLFVAYNVGGPIFYILKYLILHHNIPCRDAEKSVQQLSSDLDDCIRFRKGFINLPLNQEEEEFPLAFRYWRGLYINEHKLQSVPNN